MFRHAAAATIENTLFSTFSLAIFSAEHRSAVYSPLSSFSTSLLPIFFTVQANTFCKRVRASYVECIYTDTMKDRNWDRKLGEIRNDGCCVNN